MAGVVGRSGGWNRLSPEQHHLAGTWRRDRHAAPRNGRSATAPSTTHVSSADRRRTLNGLSRVARRLAATILDGHDGWDATGLLTLRSYVLSCERLETLQTATDVDLKALHRELRMNQQLLNVLNLE